MDKKNEAQSARWRLKSFKNVKKCSKKIPKSVAKKRRNAKKLRKKTPWLAQTTFRSKGKAQVTRTSTS